MLGDKLQKSLPKGAKAASKRDRKDDKTKVAKSQLKVNEKAMDIQCVICKSTFLKTTRAPALTEHATNKHSKTLADCFPNFVAAPAK
ncbi:At2g23090 like protein [Leptodontidium sp. 2 PMI_412]|nr:At2g23090 like protein [Leptodontidium sp. MPI-SDFR-AT-0119]KAH9207319.1 At2g23090 like protein [Leptodontidium sp. 2 PMI_412]